MMIYFMIYAREGVLFLSGDAFEGAVIPMMIVMPTLLFIGLTNIMGIQMLIPMGLENAVMISTFAGAIADLILNAILIPFFGSAGAAIGTLVAEFIVFIVQMVYLKNDIAYLYSKQNYIKIIAALIVAMIGAVAVKVLISGIFIKLVVSAVLFFGLYVIMLYIMREEVITENVNRILSRFIKSK